MDNWNLFVKLGYGIPRYCIMEILWVMRDGAVLDIRSSFGFFVRYENGFHITDTHGLGLCLLANARCVGLALSSVHIEKHKDGSLGVYFKRK